MAEGTLTLRNTNGTARTESQTKQQTYGRCLNKLFHDKITVFAMFLLVFMVGITLGAVDRR